MVPSERRELTNSRGKEGWRAVNMKYSVTSLSLSLSVSSGNLLMPHKAPPGMEGGMLRISQHGQEYKRDDAVE